MDARNSAVAPPRPLRVAYLSGPSHADRIYQDLIEDQPATFFGTNYMRQFLLLMRELEAQALIETWSGGPEQRRRIGPFQFSNVPEPRSSGLRYHFGQMRRQLAVLWRFLQFRPDVVVLTGKQEYWWVLAPLRLTRARFIASFHGLIWRQFGALKRHEKLLLWLNRTLIFRHLDAAVSTSQVISDQFVSAAGSRGRHIPLFAHLPTYDERQFTDIAATTELRSSPFEVMFMGRLEADKGVLDLLEVALALHNERPGDFVFHLCGDGSLLGKALQFVADRGLESVVHVHGYCAPQELKAVMSQCHAAVVPTRTECPAGFEMTCAEAVLSGRPLVTSAVCPALHYLGPAAMEVRPDDVSQIKDAIIALSDRPALYREKRDATAALRGQFFDPDNSWDLAMRRAFSQVLPGPLFAAERDELQPGAVTTR